MWPCNVRKSALLSLTLAHSILKEFIVSRYFFDPYRILVFKSSEERVCICCANNNDLSIVAGKEINEFLSFALRL